MKQQAPRQKPGNIYLILKQPWHSLQVGNLDLIDPNFKIHADIDNLDRFMSHDSTD